MSKGLLDGLKAPEQVNVPNGLMAALGNPNPVIKKTPSQERTDSSQEPLKEVVKETHAPEIVEQQELVQEEAPVPVQQEDPWQPLKEKFKDRLPAEVLDEYETLKREREDLRIKAEEREMAAKELQEKLVAYDPVHDPEFKSKVIDPVEEAKQLLYGVCLEDPDLYKEACALQADTKIDKKERAAKLNAFFMENNISKLDWEKGVRDFTKAYEGAENFRKNYAAIRAQKDQERVVAAEIEAKQRQDMMRQVHRTATFKAEQKLKEMGMSYLTGIEEVRNEHMLGLERALSGGGYDQEQEVLHNIVGRLVLKNNPELLKKLKKLSDLEEATRSNPNSTVASKPKDKPQGMGGIKVPSQLINH